MWSLLPMGIGAVAGLLNGGAKGAVKGAVTGAAGGAVSNLVPAANGLLPAKVAAAESIPNFMPPTMPIDAYAPTHLMSPTTSSYSGIVGSTGELGPNMGHIGSVTPPVSPVYDTASAERLMDKASPAAGGMKLMPGEHKWMDGLSGLNIVPPNLGGQPQQQMPTAPGGGVNRGGQVSADAITQLIAGMKLPQKDKRLNLFWG